MIALPNNQLSDWLIPICTQRTASMTLKQSMTGRYTCLCCSGVLLRHMRSQGVYWRCSRCHEEMPI
jgi:predicted SprT family Zn-dependent metalloprotease